MSLPFIIAFFVIALILLISGLIFKKNGLLTVGFVLISISVWQLGSYIIQTYA